MTFEHILCPVDFSDTSRRALFHAAALARSSGAHLHVLHVVAQSSAVAAPWMTPEPVALTPELRDALAQDLDQLLAGLDLVPERLHQAVLIGPPALVIVTHAGDIGADLLVIGTHGRTGIDRALLGSVAERVLHEARCPVLTIPPRAHEPFSSAQAQFKRVLAAIDFSPVSRCVVRQALSFAADAGDPVTLLHVMETLADVPPETADRSQAVRPLEDRKQALHEDLRALAADAAADGARVETMVEAGRAGHTIVRVAQEIGSELIVMGAQGHRGPALALIGSATHDVVRGAPCPVLTVTPRSSAQPKVTS